MSSLVASRPRRRRYVIATLWKPVLGFLLYSFVVVGVERYYLDYDLTVSSDLQAVASLFLGSLMALRLNTSYSKWWEARTLWGRLVNEERNFAAYVASLPRLPISEKLRMRALLLSYPNALMQGLRRPGDAIHRPSALTTEIFTLLSDWKEKAWLDGWEWSRLSLVAESFLQVCGGCERIRNSPLLRSYHLVMLATIWVYLLAAPLALHNKVWTIPVVMMLALFFLSLERIAFDVDEPFGTSPDDLPLERICLTIEGSVRQLLPESDAELTSMQHD